MEQEINSLLGLLLSFVGPIQGDIVKCKTSSLASFLTMYMYNN